MFRRLPLGSFLKVALIAAALLGLGALIGSRLPFEADRADRIQTVPLVRQIQQMGQLRTVRYNMHDILEHDRSLRPEGWARRLPGLDRLYQNVTRNTVLVVAEGGVEAGVDLSRVTPESVSRVVTPEGARLRVRLPRATVYSPDVRVQVVRRRSGLLWNDENIVPEATELARERFSQAALSGDILAAAETNAVETLTRLQRLAGRSNVEFYF